MALPEKLSRLAVNFEKKKRRRTFRRRNSGYPA
jgi:hypothetical protein